jgi:hypothetical protein
MGWGVGGEIQHSQPASHITKEVGDSTYDMKSKVSVSADISSSTCTPFAPSFLQSSVRVPMTGKQKDTP